LAEELQGARDELEAKRRELEAQGRELAQARDETRRLRQEAAAATATAEAATAAAAAAAAAKREPKLEPTLGSSSGSQADQAEPKLEPKGRGQGGSSCGGSSGAGHGPEAEAEAAAAAAAAEADEEFTLRLLALRQYIEVKRQPELAGKAAGFTWKWRLHRTAAARGQDLVEDVLGLMHGAKKKDIWRPTYVTFVNTDGHEEDGEDHGGLTVEAHSVFWREVCKSPLFSDGLPALDAPREKLFGVGRMLAKSICDDHVTGGGLSRFALEYLVHGPTGRTLASPHLALEALAECDAELAQRWRSYLDAGAVPLARICSSVTSTRGCQRRRTRR